MIFKHNAERKSFTFFPAGKKALSILHMTQVPNYPIKSIEIRIVTICTRPLVEIADEKIKYSKIPSSYPVTSSLMNVPDMENKFALCTWFDY